MLGNKMAGSMLMKRPFLKASSEGSIEGEKRPLEFVKGKGELQMYFLN